MFVRGVLVKLGIFLFFGYNSRELFYLEKPVNAEKGLYHALSGQGQRSLGTCKGFSNSDEV